MSPEVSQTSSRITRLHLGGWGSGLQAEPARMSSVRMPSALIAFVSSFVKLMSYFKKKINNICAFDVYYRSGLVFLKKTIIQYFLFECCLAGRVQTLCVTKT